MRVDACTMRVVHIVFASYSIFVAGSLIVTDDWSG